MDYTGCQAYYTSDDHVYPSHLVRLMAATCTSVISRHNMLAVHMLSDQRSCTLIGVMGW